MGRANIFLVVLVAVIVSAPLTAARTPFVSQRGIEDVRCVGEVAELLQQHEGRHRWAYDHRGRFRAIGSGYNLDDNVDERRKELQAAGLDYDKLYNGEIGLDELQITGLLILDAERALRRAGDNIERLEDFCCPLRAVFADIQHTARSADKFPREDLEQVIERAASEDYKSAADELERTKWCSKGRNRGRCRDNLDIVEEGCPKGSGQLRYQDLITAGWTLLNKIVPSSGGVLT
ncbi:hypothetical protein R1sor_025459 [Riccia sorocarpa]|uniref:Secreted protein n=1 Tax=Riccia sorocarpa TaxID=122646 RepID=A0ABD3GA85_9MARC